MTAIGATAIGATAIGATAIGATAIGATGKGKAAVASGSAGVGWLNTVDAMPCAATTDGVMLRVDICGLSAQVMEGVMLRFDICGLIGVVMGMDMGMGRGGWAASVAVPRGGWAASVAVPMAVGKWDVSKAVVAIGSGPTAGPITDTAVPTCETLLPARTRTGRAGLVTGSRPQLGTTSGAAGGMAEGMVSGTPSKLTDETASTNGPTIPRAIAAVTTSDAIGIPPGAIPPVGSPPTPIGGGARPMAQMPPALDEQPKDANEARETGRTRRSWGIACCEAAGEASCCIARSARSATRSALTHSDWASALPTSNEKRSTGATASPAASSVVSIGRLGVSGGSGSGRRIIAGKLARKLTCTTKDALGSDAQLTARS